MIRPAGVAGRPTKLRVTARDKFYNDRESGGDKFELALRPAGDRAGEAATRGDVHDMKDGTYEASVVGTTAGEYRLVVLLLVATDVLEHLKHVVFTVNLANTKLFGDFLPVLSRPIYVLDLFFLPL